MRLSIERARSGGSIGMGSSDVVDGFLLGGRLSNEC
jgi:hypothetical protein